MCWLKEDEKVAELSRGQGIQQRQTLEIHSLAGAPSVSLATPPPFITVV